MEYILSGSLPGRWQTGSFPRLLALLYYLSPLFSRDLDKSLLSNEAKPSFRRWEMLF
jgi:hypothetical protein